jgi:hypothetical protein
MVRDFVCVVSLDIVSFTSYSFVPYISEPAGRSYSDRNSTERFNTLRDFAITFEKSSVKRRFSATRGDRDIFSYP